MRLTEKTLELNIMAELSYLGRLAGYRPYFIGLSQFHEMQTGVDSSFSYGARVGFFQFKRGLPRLSFYTFYINNNKPHFNQHNTLAKLDSRCGACRYVFPLIGTNEDVYRYRGNLLFWTTMLPVRRLGLLPSPGKIHRVRLYYNGTWVRYSAIETGEWSNISGIVPDESSFERQQIEGLPFSEQQWMAKKAFNSLDLPTLDNAFKSLSTHDIEEVLRQRSAFCMVFD